MEIIQEHQPELAKPIIIAAMQDMGSVGSIVIEHINSKLKTRRFRTINSVHPTYVIDEGGYINVPLEKWEYRNTEDLIIFLQHLLHLGKFHECLYLIVAVMTLRQK